MKESKIEIIDRTIIVLKQIYGDTLSNKIIEVNELIKLLHAIGSDYIEITSEIYSELSPLPIDAKYIICSNSTFEMKNSYDILKMKADGRPTCHRISGLEDLIFYDYQRIFSEIMKAFGENIEMCIKNKYGSATGMSMEWLKAGGRKVVTTFAGIGGYAPLEEILGSIAFLEKINHSGNLKLLPKIISLFEKITDSKLKINAPFIGKDIFNVESGIHVNGIAKNPRTYEPYDPSEIGRERKIIIGKHSGISSLEIKLKELNIKYNSNNLPNMLEHVRKISTQKHRGLNNDEIKQLYEKCCI